MATQRRGIRVLSSGDPRRGDLITQNVSGGFTNNIFDLVATNPETTTEIATTILEENFPSSIHEDILQAVGLDLELETPEKRKRDPYFRDRIIRAYEHQCAVCGFNVRVGNTLVALEAAYIKWHQAAGRMWRKTASPCVHCITNSLAGVPSRFPRDC